MLTTIITIGCVLVYVCAGMVGGAWASVRHTRVCDCTAWGKCNEINAPEVVLLWPIFLSGALLYKVYHTFYVQEIITFPYTFTKKRLENKNLPEAKILKE